MTVLPASGFILCPKCGHAFKNPGHSYTPLKTSKEDPESDRYATCPVCSCRIEKNVRKVDLK